MQRENTIFNQDFLGNLPNDILVTNVLEEDEKQLAQIIFIL